MHKYWRFFSRGMEFAKNEYAYVLKVLSRSYLHVHLFCEFHCLQCTKSAMFAITLAREMTGTYRDIKLRPLALFLQRRSVPKCNFIYLV